MWAGRLLPVVRRAGLALVLCALVAHARPAAAEEATSAQKAQENTTARWLFEEGLKFVAARDWRGAEDRFRRVIALRASHVAAYNLASALDHLGHPVESAELLRAILRDPAAPRDTRSAAERLLAQVEPGIGSVTVRVNGDATDCDLTIDDKPQGLDAFGRAIAVDPGAHSIVVHRDGAVFVLREVRVGGSQPLRVETTIDIPPRASAPPPVADAPAAAPVLTPVATVAPAIEPANTRVAHAVASAPARDDDDDGLAQQWWFWAGTGVLVAGAAVVVVVLASNPGQASPVTGDTEPAVVRGMVVGAMP